MVTLFSKFVGGAAGGALWVFLTVIVAPKGKGVVAIVVATVAVLLLADDGWSIGVEVGFISWEIVRAVGALLGALGCAVYCYSEDQDDGLPWPG